MFYHGVLFICVMLSAMIRAITTVGMGEGCAREGHRDEIRHVLFSGLYALHHVLSTAVLVMTYMVATVF